MTTEKRNEKPLLQQDQQARSYPLNFNIKFTQ